LGVFLSLAFPQIPPNRYNYKFIIFLYIYIYKYGSSAFGGGTAYNIQRGEYMELCVVDNKFLKENGPVVGDTRSDWTGDYWNNDWSCDYN